MELILIIVAIAVSYFVPKMYNERFLKKYGVEVVSWEIAFLCAFVHIFGIIHQSTSWVYWLGFVLFVLLTAFSVIISVAEAIEVGASKTEVAFSAVFQILATIGVAVGIFVIIAAVFALDRKKKK